MSNPRQMDSRVATAFDLVQKQRKLVDTTQVGSRAHRQASDVLALIEESHFLLSELSRISTSDNVRAASSVPTIPQRKTERRQRLLPLQFVLVFMAAVIAATIFLEVADPTSMNIQASEVGFNPIQP